MLAFKTEIVSIIRLASGVVNRPVSPDAKSMRALSIRQPYAELILRGIKKIEYRSRPHPRSEQPAPGPSATLTFHVSHPQSRRSYHLGREEALSGDAES